MSVRHWAAGWRAFLSCLDYSRVEWGVWDLYLAGRSESDLVRAGWPCAVLDFGGETCWWTAVET